MLFAVFRVGAGQAKHFPHSHPRGIMSCKGPSFATKPAMPWLVASGLRSDDFRKRSRLEDSGTAVPPAGQSSTERQRLSLLAAAQHGLHYDVAKAKNSAKAHAVQRAALMNSTPSAFAPDRFVCFVMGRPCVALPCAHTRTLARSSPALRPQSRSPCRPHARAPLCPHLSVRPTISRPWILVWDARLVRYSW